MNTSIQEQEFIASLIDEAVDCWHEVAIEHDTKTCNCFREKFATRLIELGVFIGYDKLPSATDHKVTVTIIKAQEKP